MASSGIALYVHESKPSYVKRVTNAADDFFGSWLRHDFPDV
jgi:hypothetical protein